MPCLRWDYVCAHEWVCQIVRKHYEIFALAFTPARGWWFPSFWRITQGWVINLSRFLPEFSVWYRAACYQGKSSWHFKWRGRVQTTVFDYGGEIFFHDEDCLILVSIHYSTAFQYHNEGTEQQCNQNIMLYSPHVPGIIQEQITAMQIIRFSHYHCEEFMCHP